ncbi:MAG TPA: hypothetical protein DCL77_06285 [Prolixibacteraceae bacterium]|nr:hypothetical protein [Prolixibacteraceae bacterium]
METTDILRNRSFDKLLTIDNKDYLSAHYELVNASLVSQVIANKRRNRFKIKKPGFITCI